MRHRSRLTVAVAHSCRSEKKLPLRRLGRDDRRGQCGGTLQEGVDSGCAGATLGDGPHDERLAPAGVPGHEDPWHGGLVAVVTGDVAAPTGFVTCRDEKIDLLAVAESARGRGLGALLTNGAMHWFATNGVRRVSVLARINNDDAVRLYKRCGFVPAATEFLFHKWYKS